MGRWQCSGCADKLHSYEDLASDRAVLPGSKLFFEKLNLKNYFFLCCSFLGCGWGLCSLAEYQLVAFPQLGCL